MKYQVLSWRLTAFNTESHYSEIHVVFISVSGIAKTGKYGEGSKCVFFLERVKVSSTSCIARGAVAVVTGGVVNVDVSIGGCHYNCLHGLHCLSESPNC